jgi:hypothetical protein
MHDTFDDFIACNREIMEVFGIEDEDEYEDYDNIDDE